MYGIYLLLVLGVLVGASVPTSTAYRQQVAEVRQDLVAQEVERAHQVLLAFQKRTGTLPDTLAQALAVRPAENPLDGRVRYAITRDVDGGPWQFDRAVVWANNLDAQITDADYLANNACGADGFDDAEAWCAPPALRAFRLESRDGFADRIEEARTSILNTMQKLAQYAARESEFPRSENDGTPLINGTSYFMADLVGYGGAPIDCTGVFDFQGIPLGCEDVFVSPFGTPLVYEYLSEENVALIAQTTLERAGGEVILIGHEVRL
jgi:hypothetical protein